MRVNNNAEFPSLAAVIIDITGGEANRALELVAHFGIHRETLLDITDEQRRAKIAEYLEKRISGLVDLDAREQKTFLKLKEGLSAMQSRRG